VLAAGAHCVEPQLPGRLGRLRLTKRQYEISEQSLHKFDFAVLFYANEVTMNDNLVWCRFLFTGDAINESGYFVTQLRSNFANGLPRIDRFSESNRSVWPTVPQSVAVQYQVAEFGVSAVTLSERNCLPSQAPPCIANTTIFPSGMGSNSSTL
jgi:hypothetical protein